MIGVMSEPRVPNSEFGARVVARGGETLNLCFQCGTCTGSCPSGKETAFRIRQLIRKAQLGFEDEVLASDELWMCTTCYTCQERCPRGVEIVDIVMALRNMAVEKGHLSSTHKKAAGLLISTGHFVPLKDPIKSIRTELKLDETPCTVLCHTDGLTQVQSLAESTGLKKTVESE